MNPYLRIARPDHWFKNIFMLPGTGLALLFVGELTGTFFIHFILGVVATCLLASANYVINEFLDAEFDRFHPIKSQRPSVQGKIEAKWVILEYLAFGLIGLGIAFYLGKLFFIVSIFFLFMGFLYNVRPFRLKERVIVDVLSESINNPIRLVLGWAIVAKDILPPSSVLLAYWFGGAFLMAVKRYSEYSSIDDPERAGLYRRSFQKYTKNILLLSSFFYAMNSTLFLGVFLIKYRIEFLLIFPFVAVLFTWYLWYGLKQDGVAENPEEMYKRKWFVLYTVFVCLLIIFLFVVDIPSLSIFLEEKFIQLPTVGG
ncbi:UbiA prenyltransferase family protein [Puniceicoccus vermicola]|uniref:UbiA prenyltransferase family protein n=1 Tax=Puniceicoccus vermicola TaxID=388746 RepID=A0A7X1AY16_9BACT|nr:UbiA prenyltransferase family protein [Puniceicoccus vermicola]MBC2602052.1 UbiA prenyltransferase family protein [Puniceicoccus vermicola]